LSFTTSPSQLAHGLEALLKPFSRLGFPTRELVLVLTIALRFVPTFFEEIEKISQSQRARGVNLDSKNPYHRMKFWVPIFIPLFVSALRHAEELATAMEARGFRSGQPRTRLRQLHLTYADLAAALITVAASLVVIALGRFA